MSNKINICKANVKALQKRFEEVSKGKKDPELEKVRHLITTPDGKFSAEMLQQLKDGLLCQGPLGEIFYDNSGFDSAMKVAMSGGGDKLIIGEGAGGMGLRVPTQPEPTTGLGKIWGMGKIDTGGGRGIRSLSDPGTSVRRKIESNVPDYSKIENEKFLAREKAEKWVNAGVAAVVRYAYTTVVEKYPGVEGKIVFTISVDKTGKPSVQTHTASPALHPHAEHIRAILERHLRSGMPKFPTQTGFSFNFPCVFVTGPHSYNKGD